MFFCEIFSDYLTPFLSLFCNSDDDESEDEDGDMEVDATKQSGEAAKSSKAAVSDAKFNDITDGLRELDMDNYDDEDEGIFLFASRFRSL